MTGLEHASERTPTNVLLKYDLAKKCPKNLTSVTDQMARWFFNYLAIYNIDCDYSVAKSFCI